MAIIGIVATDRNLAIGKDGKLPWHYPADLKFFKKTTTGNTVVMGYNTWLSIGKPLPDRRNIVVSRHRSIPEFPEVTVLRDIGEILTLARGSEGDVFIIGGAETYLLFREHIDSWIVTEIPSTVDGADAFMPESFLDGFVLTEDSEIDDGLHVKVYKKDV